MEASRNVVYALAEVTFSRAVLAAFFLSLPFVVLYLFMRTSLRSALCLLDSTFSADRASGDVPEARGSEKDGGARAGGMTSAPRADDAYCTRRNWPHVSPPFFLLVSFLTLLPCVDSASRSEERVFASDSVIR